MKRKDEISQLRKLGLVSVAVLLGLLIVISPLGTSLDLLSYDLHFYLRNWVRPILNKPDNIIVVAIDEDSFRELGKKWTLTSGWPRGIHAQLIRKLKEAGAAVVAFDVLFAEPSSTEQDEALASAIDEAKNVVLVSQIDIESGKYGGEVTRGMVVDPSPIRDLARTKLRIGYSNVKPDSDEFVRGFYLDSAKFPEAQFLGDQMEKSFSLVAVEEYLKKMVGGKRSEFDYRSLTPDGFARIDFIGGRNSITTVSYYQALEPDIHFEDPGYFQDKLVFVGYAVGSESQEQGEKKDHFFVPFSRFSMPVMAGVEVHAQAANSLLQQRVVRRVSSSFLMLAGLLVSLLLGVGFLTWPLLYGSMLFVFSSIAMLILSHIAFSKNAIYISPLPILVPLLFAFLTSPFVRYWTTYKQKSFIRLAFATYLSPKLVDRLIDNPDSLRLGGEEIEGTVAFIDLAGFTTISEKLTPQKLIELMNETLGEFTEIIMKHDGMVDKYIGDCVMALWGVPMFDTNHALEACRAVLDIREALTHIQEKCRADYGVEISARVGLSSGKMVAGNVGGGMRFNYTVLGNEVNLASRLEALNKSYNTDTLLSEGTATLVRDQLALREIDVVAVKGQEKQTRIFTIFGDRVGVAPLDYRQNELYQHGRSFYRAREWAAARDAFLAALELKPNDGPSKEFLRRIEEFTRNPPPPGWDGVYRATQK